jgi:hypothetical protein
MWSRHTFPYLLQRRNMREQSHDAGRSKSTPSLISNVAVDEKPRVPRPKLISQKMRTKDRTEFGWVETLLDDKEYQYPMKLRGKVAAYA